MTRVRSWGVVSSVAAPVLLIGGWTLAARLQAGGFDSITGTISELAARDASHRWVMTAALAGVGLAHLATAAALRPASLPSRCVLAAGGVATVLVAASPLPAGGGGSGAHTASATVAFVSLAVWPAISWRRGGAVPEAARVPWPFRPPIAVAAATVLLAGLGWFFAELLSSGDRVGLSERVAAGAQALWPLLAVLTARQPARQPARQADGPTGR